LGNIEIQGNRIFPHWTMRVNYTTYDMRRDTKIISIKRHPDIMLPLQVNAGDLPDLDMDEDPHVFQYARVIGIYHVHVNDLSSGRRVPQDRIEFLHVRWFQHEPGWVSGWKARRLDRVGFVPGVGTDAFGFIDPALIVRSCHLLPAGSQGKGRGLLRMSRLARLCGDLESDWKAFYVNR
jgi:hypothetical protein